MKLRKNYITFQGRGVYIVSVKCLASFILVSWREIVSTILIEPSRLRLFVSGFVALQFKLLYSKYATLGGEAMSLCMLKI